jgi:mono/diheme cytochrome c family protein
MPWLPAVVLLAGVALALALVLSGATRDASQPEAEAVAVADAGEASAEATVVTDEIAAASNEVPVTEGAAAEGAATEAATETAGVAVADAAAQPVAFEPAIVQQGQQIYMATCMGCHGGDARGIPGIGKNLIESEFVHGLTDDQLVEFITIGRGVTDPLNTTGVMMPALGGNPALTPDQIHTVVVYLRSLSADAGQPTGPGTAVADAAMTEAPAVEAASGEATEAAVADAGTAAPSENITSDFSDPSVPMGHPLGVEASEITGEDVYSWACSTCHGTDGSGVPGEVTMTLAESQLVQNGDAEGITALFTTEHSPENPTEGFVHPYRGGYPELSDPQIAILVDYVLTLTE